MIDKASAKVGVFFAEQAHVSQENIHWTQFMDDVENSRAVGAHYFQIINRKWQTHFLMRLPRCILAFH